MTHHLDFLAFDLGAESGRTLLGQFDGERLELVEVHRFPNIPTRLPDGLHWDVLRLWAEIKSGLAMSVKKVGKELVSLGLDTWGVDFGLLDRTGALISNPYHYRDSRTDGMLEEAFRRVTRAEIFERTGIQFLSLNSLYQLIDLVVSDRPFLTALLDSPLELEPVKLLPCLVFLDNDNRVAFNPLIGCEPLAAAGALPPSPSDIAFSRLPLVNDLCLL